MSNWKTVCAWCAKQIITPHDCNERRAAEAEIKALGAVPTVAETLFQPVALNDKDMAFIEGQQWTKEQIAAMKGDIHVDYAALGTTDRTVESVWQDGKLLSVSLAPGSLTSDEASALRKLLSGSDHDTD